MAKATTEEKVITTATCSHCGGTCVLRVHVKDGDKVRVFNDRGQTVIQAKVTERIMPGVVDVPQGAWYNPDNNGLDHGGFANVLTKDEHSPGGAFASNTALVQIERI